MRHSIALAGVLLLVACEGPKGPQGASGPSGPTGDTGQIGATGASGDIGPQGQKGEPGQSSDGGIIVIGNNDGGPACAGLNAGQTPGLTAALSVSAPANGSFFVAGERAVATLQFSNYCGPVGVGSLGTANLYMYGPRGATAKTASKLLNCITNRSASDGQHHYVNLKSPKFLDTTQSNYSQSVDGTITFTFSPITDEPAGTYTVGVFAKSQGDVDQAFPLADVQIGTATVETYATGATATSTCFDCHRTPGDDKAQMHHSRPSAFGPLGNWALDLYPVGSCKACHNVDGYSVNSTLRKTHSLHRGGNQSIPAGQAHPEYGMPADGTMVEYLNVEFPSMPGAEKDCAKCHADDRWKTKPSRLACGTCHDNLFFDTGTFSPPRVFGKPSTGNCGSNADCFGFDHYAVCVTNNADPNFGACVHDVHWTPTPGDTADPDTRCTTCHNEDPSAVSSISGAHEIYATTRVPGLKITSASLAGAATAGVFQPGDIPALTFSLVDANNAPVTDLKTAPSPNPYSSTAIIAGPSDDRQRLIGPITISISGSAFVSNGGGSYTYTFPSPLPVTALSPYNTITPGGTNPTGSYTAFLYVNKALTSNGQSFRDVANAVVDFPFKAHPADATPGVRARQVVTNAACNSCHTDIQAHGGGRKDIAEQCSTCHTRGAVDRGTAVAATGAQCIVASNNCPPFQTCVASGSATLPNDGVCKLTTDPTPGQSIDFSQMIHNIHFARLREGFAEKDFLSPWTGKLAYVGFQNNISDLSDVLFSEDIRNCNKCHGDAGNSCSSDSQCGVGQHCVSKLCVNNAWLNPSARACITCHDSDFATGHAALNTWNSPDGPVETCNTCHDSDGDFSVKKVHSIRNPYVPTYSRSAE